MQQNDVYNNSDFGHYVGNDCIGMKRLCMLPLPFCD